VLAQLTHTAPHLKPLLRDGHRLDDDRWWKRIPLQQTMHSFPGNFAAAVTAAKPFPQDFDDIRPGQKAKGHALRM